MVGDLQQVDPRQVGADEPRVDGLLDIAGQEEPARADGPEQHDRHVVDPRAAVGRLGRHLSPDRPQDAQVDLIDGESVARGDRPAPGSPGRSQRLDPCRVAGTAPAHPGLEHAPDAVAREQQGQARDVVLVRMGQDDDVDPPVPRRQSLVERHEEPVGIGPAVDQEAAAA